MASGPIAIKRALPGWIAAALVAAIVLGTLGAVAMRAEPGRGLGPAEWAAIRFTVSQAVLSAAFSVLLAVPVARAFARRRFAGRRLLISLLGAPFILPVIVAVMGLLAVFGRSGILNETLRFMGLPEVSIYGLHGVVLAHVFFNLPLATRLILQGWQDIPSERFRLAAQLGFTTRDIFHTLERPMLTRTLPGAAAIIFAICLSSFAVALTLGGGPRATTVELAIYQAFRFDFDLGRAALLSCVQIALVGTAAIAALKFSTRDGFGSGLDRPVQRWDAAHPLLRTIDATAITLAALFLLLPITLVILRGAPALTSLPTSVWAAALASILLALISTVLMLALALPLAVAAGIHSARLETVGLLGIAASPLVIGTGLFIVINPIADPFALALPVTATVNAIMALPFALRILTPSVRDTHANYDRLATSLNLTGFTWLRLVLIPRIRPNLGFACGLTAAMSMGDLGVIALFADPQTATLPLQMYRLMGAYRMELASGAAVLLLGLSFGIFWLFDKGGRAGADA